MVVAGSSQNMNRELSHIQHWRTQVDDLHILLFRRRRSRVLTAPLSATGFLGWWSQYGWCVAAATCVLRCGQLHRCIGAALAVGVHREWAGIL